MADSHSSHTMPEGLRLCNGAVSEKILQFHLVCVRLSCIELINLLKACLGEFGHRQTDGQKNYSTLTVL